MNTTTYQRIAIDSKEGKAFLRTVARTHNDWKNEWHFRASPETDWKITFSRTICGEVGDPDVYVQVETDSVVSVDGRGGKVKSFSDSEEVFVPHATIARLTGSDVRTAARLLLDGWKFCVQHSGGSTSSSKHGLAFVSLHVERRTGENWDDLSIGGESVFVNGSFVCRGAVE